MSTEMKDDGGTPAINISVVLDYIAGEMEVASSNADTVIELARQVRALAKAVRESSKQDFKP